MPVELPPGIPPAFDEDVEAGNVPAAALIPLGGSVTGRWDVETPTGESIVVAWEMPGPDPLARDRGIVAWRRTGDVAAPWRPVWGVALPAGQRPVLGVDGQLADVTDDGSPDAVLTAARGGSGACATTLVVDLAAGRRVFRSDGCDRTVSPSADPVGLSIREAVYAPGDPHCCPSEIREVTLVYRDGAWEEVAATTRPA